MKSRQAYRTARCAESGHRPLPELLDALRKAGSSPNSNPAIAIIHGQCGFLLPQDIHDAISHLAGVGAGSWDETFIELLVDQILQRREDAERALRSAHRASTCIQGRLPGQRSLEGGNQP